MRSDVAEASARGYTQRFQRTPAWRMVLSTAPRAATTPPHSATPKTATSAQESAKTVASPQNAARPETVCRPLATAVTAPRGRAELVASQHAQSGPCEEYVIRLERSVRARLQKFLQGAPANGGHNMVGVLDAQQALPIKKGADGLQTFKEQWNWANCHLSLSTQGLYGAPGNACWLRLELPKWEGSHLPACRLT